MEYKYKLELEKYETINPTVQALQLNLDDNSTILKGVVIANRYSSSDRFIATPPYYPISNIDSII